MYNISIDKIKELRNIFYDTHYKNLAKWWLYPEQIAISDSIIEQFIIWHKAESAKDIYVNVTRQFWKSFIVFSMIWFFLIFMPKILNKKITIWITINKKEQVKKNFNEVRDILREIISIYNLKFMEDSNNAIKLSNWSKIVIFSMEAKNNEWETLDLSIVDEAQELNNEKYDKEIFPMLSRTWGVSIFVWVWWYKKNSYYEGLKDYKKNIIHKYDCYNVMETVSELYKKTWDISHKRYLKKVQEAKEKLTEIAFKTQYELGWEIWLSTFINLEQFKTFKINKNNLKNNLVTKVAVWIDWAREKDWTVVTITWKYNWKYWILDIFWIEKIWISYPEQFKLIKQFLLNSWYNNKIEKIYTDSTWVWKAVTDFLKLEMKYKIEEISFSTKRKNIMWTNFVNIFESWKLFYVDWKESLKLENELEHLEKEYDEKWNMKYHHPKWDKFHDDYVDSLFLALLHNTSKVWFTQYR